MNYTRLMEAARRTNAARTATERRRGFATPDDGPISEHIRTAMMAIEAGITIGSWTNIAEAQAMLEDVVTRLNTEG